MIMEKSSLYKYFYLSENNLNIVNNVEIKNNSL